MNIYIKPTLTLSIIFGAILGFLLVIPLFTFNLIMCLLSCFVGFAVVLYLKKNDLVGILEAKDGAIIGTISGFTCIAVACLVYVPLFWMIASMFPSFGAGLGLSAVASILIKNFNILLMIIYIFFFGILGAISNSFTAFLTVFIYEKLDTSKPEDTTHFIVEED